MNRAVLIFALMQAAYAACVPVTADRITGAELALADPALAVFPATMSVAFAPAPGTSLVVSPTDIVRLAKSHGVNLDASPVGVCFAFGMRKLSADEVSAALRRTLPTGAVVEVVDLPSTELPVGELNFPITALEPVAEAQHVDVQLWRGFVQYTPTRRAPVWARVRIRNGLEELILTTDVPRGTTLTKEMFVAKAITGLASRQPIATRLEQIVGTAAKLDLKAGQRLLLSAVEQPQAVKRGDVVSVEVHSGAARLQLDAIAQRGARDGETMEFLNPLSGKTFKARVEGTKAVVYVGGRL